MIEQDKANHALAGALTAAITFPILGWWSILACVIVAVGKESYDYFHIAYHTPDWLDAAWTLVGSSLIFISQADLRSLF